MTDLEWSIEQDGDWGDQHVLRIGNFELVVRSHYNEYEWFVNHLDKNGDIEWHAFIEGTGKSVYAAKRAALKWMKIFSKDFATYNKKIEKETR
jgi:hypothetical protein